nr:hypothetical protein [Tanacetum cinerariifolium]
MDGEDIDWSGHIEKDTKNYAMMAYSNSGSDNKSVFMNKECDLEDTPVNDRYVEGMHVVPPPMTGNYMPSGLHVEMDYSKFTYGLKQTSVDDSDAKPSENASNESDTNVETTTSMPAPVDNAPKVVCEPKVWTDAPIIKEYESDSDDDSGGSVAFGGNNERITGKGKIKDGRLDFEDVYYVEELKHYNLFSVSQICDKKNKVFFIDTDCLVLSPNFKLPDENQVLLEIPRQHNMYSFNLKNIDPCEDLSCLLEKASIDESNKWHRRLGYVNFKNLNKLVKGNLVRGQDSELCESTLTDFTYELIWTYLYETTPILKDIIRQAENQFNHKVKTIRSDSGTEFKNHDLIDFCGLKGIYREYINAKTPQQNGIVERNNRTLIEAARTMLADSFLPTTFWAEAVKTACYVLNRLLVTKPQKKIPYELLTGRQPIISYLRPFGCHVSILNTIDQLGKFDGKFDLGFLVGYSLNSKSFRVYNLETKRVEENLHVNSLENKPNIAGKRHAWMFDLDYLTNSMNYEPVSIENQANKSAGDKIEKNEKPASQVEQIFQEEHEKLKRQEKEANNAARKETTHKNQDAHTTALTYLMFPSEEIFTNSSYDDEGVITNFNNLKTTVNVKQKEDGIFNSQDKYVVKILKKFDFLSVKTASTPIETQKPLVKDKEAADMDIPGYSQDFTPSGCEEDLRKSTTGGCQFLGRRLISWQYKKQTIVATSTTEADYVAAAHCYGQVLWIQNQLLDYGFNLMNKKIYTDNESTICIVKNPVFHSKTKHIEIQHHFIRDAYEKKLIYVLKIHTDDNVADLLTKAFDVSSKELASPKQTALDKDESNPLIVDSLLKTIWLSMHHVIAMKHWLVQSKRLLIKTNQIR